MDLWFIIMFLLNLTNILTSTIYFLYLYNPSPNPFNMKRRRFNILWKSICFDRSIIFEDSQFT